jgi:hypothetical protein
MSSLSNRLPVLATEIRKAHADVQDAAKTAAQGRGRGRPMTASVTPSMMTPRSWAGWRWNFEAPPACKFTVWRLLKAAGERRPLTRAEIRLRCASQPWPWRDLGISPSTWYRRRKRAAGKS